TLGELALVIKGALHRIDASFVEAVLDFARRRSVEYPRIFVLLSALSAVGVCRRVAELAGTEVLKTGRKVIDNLRVREVCLAGVFDPQLIDSAVVTVNAAKHLVL